MKPRVYIETSILSYLTARPSRDLVQAAPQPLTIEWWTRRDRFELVVSEAVLAEASRGDPAAAARRIAVAEGLPVLSATIEAQTVARRLLNAVMRDHIEAVCRESGFRPPIICTPEQLAFEEET